MEISGGVPKNAEWKVKHIKKVLKQTINLVPTSGGLGVQVDPLGRIFLDLPIDTDVDLSTLVMYFDGWTDVGEEANGGATGYNQVRFFPRNTQSIIQNLEIQINGRSIQNIPEYNYIYNILNDFTVSKNNVAIRNIGENADPSNKAYQDGTGVIVPRRGYPIGLTAVPQSSQDKATYCIRNWLGFLDGSTKIINTGMLGVVTLIITLAPSAITMLGTPNTGAVGAVAAGANDCGIALVAGAANAAAVPALGNSYHINNVSFTINKYLFPPEYYSAMHNALSSGAKYKLYFPNYNVITCQPILSTAKAVTCRAQITTRSLDCVIGTFRAANYNDNNDATNEVVNGNMNHVMTADNPTGIIGNAAYTFNSLLANGIPVIFNNSKYFVRNGESVATGTWTIGNTRLNTETPQEMFEGVLRHYNIQQDTLTGMYPMYQNLGQFQKYGFAHILSLQVQGENNEPYTVSGLDTDEVPVNIQWQTTSAAGIVNDAVWGICNTANNCLPLLIACYTSSIEIENGRNIVYIP